MQRFNPINSKTGCKLLLVKSDELKEERDVSNFDSLWNICI